MEINTTAGHEAEKMATAALEKMLSCSLLPLVKNLPSFQRSCEAVRNNVQ